MEFESISDEARYYNITQSDITHCCNREKINIVNGFLWRFKGDDYDVKTIELKTKVVYQYDYNGNFINKFDGVLQAEKLTGIKILERVVMGNIIMLETIFGDFMVINLINLIYLEILV